MHVYNMYYVFTNRSHTDLLPSNLQQMYIHVRVYTLCTYMYTCMYRLHVVSLPVSLSTDQASECGREHQCQVGLLHRTG